MSTHTASVQPLEATTKISRSGQTTFPAKIMKQLGLKEGDQIRFVLNAEGVLTVEPVQLLSAEQLYGMFNQPDDDDKFVLDLNAAREERAGQILANVRAGGE
ncbi:AbrB/MazE/SpoVT family DNA-binding domain-containing protein [Saccharibacillus sp. CPCC 101409]|uniref:AbrB/MazE/SpoVT family DNA-binding domain-containing protein n=1 Tax=Saccharibacillus sp. CPCC 101409 TaxID=3058041 RepID=UPI0026740F6E|nr:AbrB/MazE/SpoVT family DNA-binding domain-containing protein [Saccharibacillus sp. CPCC 101409]MDO3408649.1 AbrB/MazE/SpoVT family DNA-binding domain-containing protein [Saccharibacillus sp. CPCC 101409]